MDAPAQALLDEVQANLQLRARSRAARRLSGVSQDRMAAAIQVDRTTLARWESGAMTPRPAQRRRWAELVDELERAAR